MCGVRTWTIRGGVAFHPYRNKAAGEATYAKGGNMQGFNIQGVAPGATSVTDQDGIHGGSGGLCGGGTTGNC